MSYRSVAALNFRELRRYIAMKECSGMLHIVAIAKKEYVEAALRVIRVALRAFCGSC